MKEYNDKVQCVYLDYVFYAIETLGWQGVFLKYTDYKFNKLIAWLNNNCTDRVVFQAVVFQAAGFAFENKEDAAFFKLKWA